MLVIEGIEHSFGGKQVLAGVSVEIPDGALCGLIGPSGGGKSVLLKILGGVLEPERGSVRYPFGSDGRVSLMFQEGALFDSLTVFDNVAFPLVQGRVPTFILPRQAQEEAHERVDAILDRVGLARAAYKLPGQLSGGMRKRVSLARALVARPDLALLDDPTSGLDPVASSVIMNLITDLHATFNPTMVIVSHDLRRLLPVVTHVVALFEGRVVFSGPAAELAESSYQDMLHFVACRYDFNGPAAEGHTV